MLAHQIAAIDEQEHENEHDGKPYTVTHLRKNENFLQRSTGDKDHSSPHDDHSCVQAVEDWRIFELAVNPRFKTHPFTDDVSSGQWQDGRGKQGCVEKAKGK